MEINKGFKQTEIGVIPKDWDTLYLSECSDKITDGEHQTPRRSLSGYYLLSARNIHNGRIDLSDVDYVPKDEYLRIRQRCNPDCGDILISCSGTIGRVTTVPRDFECVMVRSAALIKPSKNKLDGKYAQYFLQTAKGQSQIFASLNQGAQANLFLGHIQNLKIALPKDKKEQEAIANALSETDAYIESLEKLIAKKCLIKKGIMQDLLTGKLRLAGFKDKWKTRSFGELFQFSGGYSASRDDLSNEGHPYLHYGDIHTSSKTYIDLPKEAHIVPKLNIPLSEASTSSVLQHGDVVFVDASEDDEGTSKHVVVYNPEKRPFISGLHTIVAKSRTDEIDINFRRFCFQTDEVKKQFKFYAVGTKVSGISKSNITKINLTFPSKEEQKTIANFLIDIESEQEVLVIKLQKARLLKQGMMQELLTGRIRLI